MLGIAPISRAVDGFGLLGLLGVPIHPFKALSVSTEPSQVLRNLEHLDLCRQLFSA